MASLAAERGIDLLQKPGRIKLSGGVYIEVDAATPDGGIVVEVYARQGALKGSQLKKIAQDILKLALLKREIRHAHMEAVLAFASQEAHDSISGWLGQAAVAFEVDFVVVDIPTWLREKIRAAQERQVMVNLDVIADDVAAPVDR